MWSPSFPFQAKSEDTHAPVIIVKCYTKMIPANFFIATERQHAYQSARTDSIRKIIFWISCASNKWLTAHETFPLRQYPWVQISLKHIPRRTLPQKKYANERSRVKNTHDPSTSHFCTSFGTRLNFEDLVRSRSCPPSFPSYSKFVFAMGHTDTDSMLDSRKGAYLYHLSDSMIRTSVKSSRHQTLIKLLIPEKVIISVTFPIL